MAAATVLQICFMPDDPHLRYHSVAGESQPSGLFVHQDVTALAACCKDRHSGSVSARLPSDAQVGRPLRNLGFGCPLAFAALLLCLPTCRKGAPRSASTRRLLASSSQQDTAQSRTPYDNCVSRYELSLIDLQGGSPQASHSLCFHTTQLVYPKQTNDLKANTA